MNILEILYSKQKTIEELLFEEEKKIKHPLYCSVDIRHADYKMTGVDTNFFPAGFNNLCGKSIFAGASILKEYIPQHFGRIKNIILISESHSRNTFYHSSLVKIVEILQLSGYSVKVGILGLKGEYPFEINVGDIKMHVEQVRVHNGNVFVGDFKADLLLLNNDLSAGLPDFLTSLQIPVTPSFSLGWHERKKSNHFDCFSGFIESFARKVEIDPWLLSTIHTSVKNVAFQTGEGMERIAEQTDLILKKIAEKYKEYNIKDDPYVFIKNNSGTYGMGIITLRKGEDIFTINRKIKNKMTKGKNSIDIHEVFIQEGVTTTSEIQGDTSEPVIYFMGGRVIGGFFRTNREKNSTENLNSRGMSFANFCLAVQPGVQPTEGHHHCYEETSIFNAIKNSARLSNIAAALEEAKIEERLSLATEAC
ncbi:MAG: glutamate--cysteine ligase [Nitrospinae bacterium]|nr:glutamate--cysteine ligase [Nitrospinota bacterium]